MNLDPISFAIGLILGLMVDCFYLLYKIIKRNIELQEKFK